MEKNQYREEPLKDNVEEMFIGPFGSSLKNECFVDERNAYCMVYEQKHAIQKTLAGKNRFVDRNKYQELKRFTVKPGDIIVSCRGTIGETFIIPENAPLGIMHPSIMKIRLKPNVYNIEYFNLLLKSRLEAHNKSANGSGVKMAISATELGKDLFPIPPMDEQQKISRIFFMVEHLMLLRKQQLAKMDELVKARFVEMFGDFKSNSKGWSIVKFDEFAQIDGNMTTDYKKYADYPHIGIDSIEKGTGTLKGYRTVKEDGVVSGKYIFTPQHIIYSKIRPNLNKVALPDFEGLCSADAYPILPNPKNCNRIFLALAMRSDYFLDYILQFSARTNLPKVNRKEIAGFSMPLPPLSLQNDFATFVERVDQQKQTVQQSLEKLELMKKALMQEYFG